ncbi:MAG: gluconokinase [Nitrospira sp.]|nr:gluconokinase [Nitrospira sp.]MCP9475663.1 gluconokinase [Nitrospira sp.]
MEVSPVVILIMGVSGSGKTTVGRLLAEQIGWHFADADDFHSTDNRDKLAKGIPLTDEDRQPWLNAIRSAIASWVAQGRPTVLACSALKAAYRSYLVQGWEDVVRSVYLKGSADLIARRLADRTDHFMHKDLLASQFETLEEPGDALTVAIDESPDRIVAAIRSHLDL